MALADRVRRYAPATLRHATPATARRPVVAMSQCRSVADTVAIDSGSLAAVLLRGTCWGDVWLIADDDVLTEHPDIVAGGLPVVRFAELPYVQRLDAEALRALGLVKRTFPTARVLQ